MREERKERVAFVHGPLVVGGAEKALINMLRFFDYDRYDVTLWLRDDSGPMQVQVDPRVTIKYWGEHLAQNYGKYVKELLKGGKWGTLARSLCCRFLSKLFLHDWHRNFKYYIKSLPPLSEECYDAAISYHSLVRDDILVLDYAVKAKQKMGWIHGACRHDPRKDYFRPFTIEYDRLDHIFCVSESVRDIFLGKYPSLADRTSVMYNLQDFQRIRELAREEPDVPYDGLTLATVGRLAKEKGQDLIPKIARRLREGGYRFTWYIVGDGDNRETIEKEIEIQGVGECVKLLGNKMNPYPYIKNCSLYVQPSYSEGFCLTTFEAKILNKPVVVTDVPVMRELFAEGEAIICQPTVESLTVGIRQAIERLPELQSRHFDFTDAYNTKELEKLYQVIEG